MIVGADDAEVVAVFVEVGVFRPLEEVGPTGCDKFNELSKATDPPIRITIPAMVPSTMPICLLLSQLSSLSFISRYLPGVRARLPEPHSTPGVNHSVIPRQLVRSEALSLSITSRPSFDPRGDPKRP